MIKSIKEKITDKEITQKQKVINWLLKENNNYCAMPYRHMAIESNGDVRPCCMGTEFPGINIKKQNTIFSNNPTQVEKVRSIDSLLNDPVRQKFIDSFDKNFKHPACNTCWKDNNRHSTRVHFSTHPSVIETTIAAMNNQPEGRTRKLTWLEIKPGNRCNLKCRICGVHNSSQWTKDSFEFDKQLGRTDKNKNFKNSSQFKYTQSCEWIDDKEFWHDINSFDDINQIHIMGGEPFMVLEHFTLLETLISSKKIDTKKIKLVYNTNGTYFPTVDQLRVLENFFEVLIHISIDDIEKRFEYQRHPANWKEVKENLKKYQQLNKNSKVIYSAIDPTVSIYNIWWIPEIEKEFNNLGYTIGDGAIHFVLSGSNDCRLLPPQILDYLTKRYIAGTPWQKNIAKYLKTAKPYDAKKLSNSIKKINIMDSIRKESFADINSELYRWIQPYI